MKTLVLAAALALLLAAPASAKEIAGLQLCGASGCVTERDRAAIATLREGPGGPMSDTSLAVAPARPAPWYRARVLILEPGGKHFAGFAFYYVPSADAAATPGLGGGPTTMTWAEVGGGWKTVLDRLAHRVDAFGPPHLTRVTVNGDPVADPASWLRVFQAGAKTDRYPQQADLRQVQLFSSPRSPWSDGNDIAFSPSSRILVRDGEIVELPAGLTGRMRDGASLAGGPSFRWGLAAAVVAALAVAAAALLLAVRRLPTRRPLPHRA